MRLSTFTKYSNYLNFSDLANIFDVNIDKYGYALYNLNESLVVKSGELPDNIFEWYIPHSTETPLMIAYNLYNDIRLYWIILKLNNISNSFYKFTPSDRVKYIKYNYVNSILKTM
jgi:hypothetical protein